jgi:hypothetical protein
MFSAGVAISTWSPYSTWEPNPPRPAGFQAYPRQPDADGWYAGIFPATLLQSYLGHEHLDTTMIYAEVSDPILRQGYYQGIAALDPGSENLSLSGVTPFNQHTSAIGRRISGKLGVLCLSACTAMLRCLQATRLGLPSTRLLILEPRTET